MTARFTVKSWIASKRPFSMKASLAPSFKFFGLIICSIVGESGASKTIPVDLALASIPRTVV